MSAHEVTGNMQQEPFFSAALHLSRVLGMSGIPSTPGLWTSKRCLKNGYSALKNISQYFELFRTSKTAHDA